MNAPDFGRATVITILRRERATFADNLRRCRDVHQIRRYEAVVAEIDATIASLDTPAKPQLQAVA
jgi:hypothetical protein